MKYTQDIHMLRTNDKGLEDWRMRHPNIVSSQRWTATSCSLWLTFVQIIMETIKETKRFVLSMCAVSQYHIQTENCAHTLPVHMSLNNMCRLYPFYTKFICSPVYSFDLNITSRSLVAFTVALWVYQLSPKIPNSCQIISKSILVNTLLSTLWPKTGWVLFLPLSLFFCCC